MIRLAIWVGGVRRHYEVQAAIDAGLHADCMQLMKNWSTKKTNRFFKDRIFSGDPEYAKLPASIRMLSPFYVTKDWTDMPNWPTNIGLCKDGFGGFAMGVRVFNNDQDANKLKSLFDCQRVANGVYIWWQGT